MAFNECLALLGPARRIGLEADRSRAFPDPRPLGAVGAGTRLGTAFFALATGLPLVDLDRRLN